MQLKTLEFEFYDHVGLIRINRPHALNALNGQVIIDLRALVMELAQRRDVRACILTGAGDKAFVAGADIKEMETLTAPQAREMAIIGQNLFQQIENLHFPVVAALNGFALGGGLELALACDFILAADQVRWGLPEVTLGLIPGYGGTQRLTRNVGRTIARRVALSGEVFTARQGYEWGLFAQVMPSAELMPATWKLANELAKRAPRALALAKQAINQGADRPLGDGLRLEADLFGRAFETKDHAEGIAAFIEKRPPKFQGL